MGLRRGSLGGGEVPHSINIPTQRNRPGLPPRRFLLSIPYSLPIIKGIILPLIPLGYGDGDVVKDQAGHRFNTAEFFGG